MKKHSLSSSGGPWFALCAPLILAAQAHAQTAAEIVCEDGPTTKIKVISTVVTIIGSFVMTGVGLQTLSRSLARGGHKQSSSTLAGVGFGAFLGGASGAAAMALNECGFMQWPGYLGAGVAAFGFIVLLFAIATGKNS